MLARRASNVASVALHTHGPEGVQLEGRLGRCAPVWRRGQYERRRPWRQALPGPPRGCRCLARRHRDGAALIGPSISPDRANPLVVRQRRTVVANFILATEGRRLKLYSRIVCEVDTIIFRPLLAPLGLSVPLLDPFPRTLYFSFFPKTSNRSGARPGKLPERRWRWRTSEPARQRTFHNRRTFLHSSRP
jgi:hypothetical protein